MITKTQSEILFDIDSHEVSGADVIINCMVANYYGNAGSIGLVQFSLDLGVNYQDCTLSSSQLESDLDSIPLGPRKRKVPILWEAASDIHVLEEFTNVKIKITFYDRTNQGGTQSEAVVYNADSIDLRPSESIILERPYPGEPELNFQHKTIVSVRSVNYHFQVQVAEASDTDFSNPVFTAKSETDQTGWTLDGSAFPSTGAPSATSVSGLKSVAFSSATLTALDIGSYNVRVLRSLHDPDGILPPTYPDNW